MSIIRVERILAVLLCSGVAVPRVLAQHEGDIGVGRSSDNQMKTKPFDPDGVPCFDPALGIGLLTYYPASNSFRSDSPGFDANFEADPENDYFALQPGVSVRLVAHADLEPAFRVKYQTFQIRYAGDYIPLGSATLHRHVIFIVDCNDPAYDPLRTLWYGTFILRDVGSTGYADSAPFTIRMSVVDCVTGDVNGDGQLGFADINPFVIVILDPASATADERCAADVDRDGYVTFADINRFVWLLVGG